MVLVKHNTISQWYVEILELSESKAFNFGEFIFMGEFQYGGPLR